MLNTRASAPLDPTAPPAPTSLEDSGISEDALVALALKTAHTVPRFTTEWMTGRLHMSGPIVATVLERLRSEHQLEMLGQVGPFNHRFAITDRGREHARRLLDISRYIGPAPVALSEYTTSLERQFEQLPDVRAEDVRAALAPLVLPPEVVELAGLAASSRRSLFLHGPPGNGKTTLGHLLHQASRGSLWIPYVISVDDSLIRVFDRQCHQRIDEEEVDTSGVDRRWVKIRRPLIVVGGELTLEALDLAYSESRGSYEAPLHFKANGGTFLLDDFGCQRAAPAALLNRWIHPLERNVDFLTLRSGQQIEVPFRQMLIVSTNQDPEQVMSPAFLRRMGYRLLMPNPSDQQYRKIFERYVAGRGLSCEDDVVDKVIDRYARAGRRPAACEPRDLIERCAEVCRYRGRPERVDAEVLELAWHGYFGD